jgi:GNAT superfamily N-acetyltransferase
VNPRVESAGISLDRVADLSDLDRAAIRALSLAVYPPAEAATWPGRHLEWAKGEWCVRVWGDASDLVSYTNIVLRQAGWDGRPVRVGGIGGVMTHPAARGRGHAARGIRRAMDFFREQGGVAFALLVCEPGLLGYYGRLGWLDFHGRLRVRQLGEPADFTFNRVMVHDLEAAGPTSGTVDLMGPPW